MLSEKNTLNLQTESIVKFFLTLSVVLYHSIMAWSVFGWHGFEVQPMKGIGYFTDFLGKFHTPAFTFLSGWLFYYLRYEKGKYQNTKNDIIRRAKRLLVPYFFMVCWVVPFYFLLEGGNLKTAVLKYVLAGAPSQLWYLIMLFGVFIIFYFLSDCFNKRPLIFMVIFYALFGIATVLSKFIPDIFQVWTILKFLLYFHYGFCIRKGILETVWRIRPVWFIIIYSVLIFFDYYFLFTAEGLMLNALASAISPIISLLGITCFVNLFSRISFDKFNNIALCRIIGKYKFTIFLFHQQLVYIPLAFWGKTINPLILIIINFTFSLLGAVIISILLSKFKITKRIFGI